MRAPRVTEKETRKRSDSAQFLLTGRFGGSDRTLPPSIRSILERSNSSGIMTGHSQSPDNLAFVFFTRPDAETSSDRTLKDRVRSLLCSEFTSCELTGRWTLESGAASDHSFFSKSSMFLRVACSKSSPNLNKTQINTNWD